MHIFSSHQQERAFHRQVLPGLNGSHERFEVGRQNLEVLLNSNSSKSVSSGTEQVKEPGSIVLHVSSSCHIFKTVEGGS